MSKPPSKDTMQVELQELRREIEDLKRQMRQVPSRFPMVAAQASDGRSIRETIVAGNSFAAEDVVYHNGSTWALARANSATGSAKYTGVVESSTGSEFVIVYAGRIELALTPGTTYYLSDTVDGLVVPRASITEHELVIPVLRCVSSSACIVMPGRDIGSDLTTLTAGDLANGGGQLVVNLSSTNRVTIDDTDGLTLTLGSNTIQIDLDGVVTCDYGTNSVVINPSHFVGTGKAVQLRELSVCNEDNEPKTILALCSDFYDP